LESFEENKFPKCVVRCDNDVAVNPLRGMRAGHLGVTDAFGMRAGPFTAAKGSRYTRAGMKQKRAEKTRCQKSIVTA
jgi:hypothetical protein